MKTKNFLKCAATVLFLIVFAVGCAGTKSKTQSEKNAARDSVRTMTEETLAQLYQKAPAAEDAVADAAGYAVFSDFGVKILIMGGAGGSGMAVDNATKQEDLHEDGGISARSGFGGSKVPPRFYL